MNQFKNEIKSNYTLIPNVFANDPSLSWKAKGIFLYLASKPNDWKFFMADIQKHATDGKSALQTGLKELTDQGYLIREKSTDENNQFDGWDWILTMPDNQVSRQPDFPVVGKSVGRKTASYTKNNSTKTENNTKKDIHICDFDIFWEQYGKKKGRSEALKLWKKLDEESRNKAIETIPAFQTHFSEQKFIPNPAKYLAKRYWEDEGYQVPQSRKKTKGDRRIEQLRQIDQHWPDDNHIRADAMFQNPDGSFVKYRDGRKILDGGTW